MNAISVRAVGAQPQAPQVPALLAGASVVAVPGTALYVVDGECAASDLAAALRELGRLPGVFRVEFGPLADASAAERAAQSAGLPKPTHREAVGAALAAVQPSRWRDGAQLVVEHGAPSVAVFVGTHGLRDAAQAALTTLRDVRGLAGVGIFEFGVREAIVVETGDAVRSPLHRTLAAIELEAKRLGGALASATLITRVPLAALLGTLAASMPLAVQPAQVLETHLTGGTFGTPNTSRR